jgi:hypothetical protein
MADLWQYHPKGCPFDPYGHKHALANMYLNNLPSWLMLPRRCDGDHPFFIFGAHHPHIDGLR